MKVEKIMHSPICVRPEETVLEVLTKISEVNSDGLLVTSNEQVLGVIARRELVSPKIIQNDQLTALDLMCSDFPIIHQGDEVQKVWDSDMEVLPVYDQEILIGMVTRADAGMAICSEKARLVKTFDAVANSVTNGIVAIDHNGKITLFNKAAEKFTRRKQEEAIGAPLGDMLIPKGLLDIVNTGQSQFDFRIEAFNHAYISNRTPIIQDGKVIGAVGVFQDISQIEESLHELQILNQLNAELNMMINSSYDGIIVTDPNGRVERANSAACKLCQSDEQAILHCFVDDVLQIQKPSLWQTILSERKAVTKEFSTRHLIVTGNPVYREDGILIRVIFNLRDLSVLHQLNDELMTSKELTNHYQQELVSLRKGEKIIAHSPKMLAVLDLAKRVASVDSSVFIKGESGSGKELIAKFIHENSKRSSGPFIQVNCAAIPEALLESELFGYEGGAFTGSRKEGKAGLFELANQGTLLLDEIGDLPLVLQTKLLRVLQEREFLRVGGTKTKKVDVRIISATHKDIAAMVEQGQFREDLFFRLHVVPLSIPALRERREDILPLVYNFRDQVLNKYGLDVDFAPDVLQWFLGGEWPGNVRQLQNTVEQLIVTCPGTRVTQSQSKNEQMVETSVIQVHEILPLKEASTEVERQIISLALLRTQNTYDLAKLLGVNQSTVVRKLQRLGKTAVE